MTMGLEASFENGRASGLEWFQLEARTNKLNGGTSFG